MDNVDRYSHFKDFIDKYLPQGFLNINRDDLFILELEKRLKASGQYFHIADMLQMKVLFASEASWNFINHAPEEVHISTFFMRTHPDDQVRHNLARTKTVKIAQDLFISKDGFAIHSSFFKQLHPAGHYYPLLYQAYLFYNPPPTETVYFLLVLTDLTSFTINKHRYHYYLGNDLSMFRFPDQKLLLVGHNFSEREFEILKLIALGMGSEQIADKLSLSVNTVNTHRRNLLKKTKKSTTHELVIELQEHGIL